jgi:RNA exonuclease 4
MVGIGPTGKKNAIARVSIVNYDGNLLFDTFVMPGERVTDWRTKYSGIRPADVRGPHGLISISTCSH